MSINANKDTPVQTINKDIKGNFVMIPKSVITNKDLSLKSKMVLTYLLSKPDHWKVVLTDIMENIGIGSKALRQCMKELRDLGFIIKKQIRENGKIAGCEYSVFASPEAHFCRVETAGQKPTGQKRTSNNKDISNKENKKSSSKEEILPSSSEVSLESFDDTAAALSCDVAEEELQCTPSHGESRDKHPSAKRACTAPVLADNNDPRNDNYERVESRSDSGFSVSDGDMQVTPGIGNGVCNNQGRSREKLPAREDVTPSKASSHPFYARAKARLRREVHKYNVNIETLTENLLLILDDKDSFRSCGANLEKKLYSILKYSNIVQEASNILQKRNKVTHKKHKQKTELEKLNEDLKAQLSGLIHAKRYGTSDFAKSFEKKIEEIKLKIEKEEEKC